MLDLKLKCPLKVAAIVVQEAFYDALEEQQLDLTVVLTTDEGVRIVNTFIEVASGYLANGLWYKPEVLGLLTYSLEELDKLFGKR